MRCARANDLQCMSFMLNYIVSYFSLVLLISVMLLLRRKGTLTGVLRVSSFLTQQYTRAIVNRKKEAYNISR